MKKILMICLMAFALAASAADFAALRQAAAASQAAVTSPGAVCNHGDGETFAEFLVKFTVEPAFNAERSKLSKVFALSDIKNYRALVVTQGHEAGYNQQWGDIGPDRVLLVCGYSDCPPDYSYLFRRIDGKWFLVDRIVDVF